MGEEDKADKGRGGKTTSGNGQAWSSPNPRGQWKTGKVEETGCEIICLGIDDDDDVSLKIACGPTQALRHTDIGRATAGVI